MQDSAIPELLNCQLSMLANIADLLKAPKLGFHDAPRPTTIYANRSNGCLWYTLKNGSEVMPLEHDAITGYPKDLKFEEKERRGKRVWKSHLYLHADRPYRIESGFDSVFTKGLLMSLASLSPGHLCTPITIAAAPGDDESVLFCNVYLGSTPVSATWDEQTDWKAIAKEAIDNVRNANS